MNPNHTFIFGYITHYHMNSITVCFLRNFLIIFMWNLKLSSPQIAEDLKVVLLQDMQVPAASHFSA